MPRSAPVSLVDSVMPTASSSRLLVLAVVTLSRLGRGGFLLTQGVRFPFATR